MAILNMAKGSHNDVNEYNPCESKHALNILILIGFFSTLAKNHKPTCCWNLWFEDTGSRNGIFKINILQ